VTGLTEVTAELADGPPDLVLREESASAALLVVGALGMSWATAAGLGSVATALTHGSSSPVLVHRTPQAGQRRRGVVVGLDGGPGSPSVLAAAAEAAVLRQVPLRVVHAWQQLTEDDGQPLRRRPDDAATQRAERADVAEMVTELRADQPGLDVDLAVLTGRAGPVLASAARSAEVLVVGRLPVAPGRLPGPTSHSLVQRAACPVLVVPVPACSHLVPSASDAGPHR
jgi:nucleotide-binding universal stress UspA family protein